MEPKKTNKKKVILVGLGLAALTVAGYFGWTAWQNRNREEELPELPESPQASLVPKVTGNDNFPLKRGSRGSRVRMVQEALMKKYGGNILPKYGADGQYGAEMETALKAKGLPTVIDEKAFNSIIGGQQATPASPPAVVNSTDAQSIAKALHTAASSRKVEGVAEALKKIKTVNDYVLVGNYFKEMPLFGVRQTIVNALLTTFPFFKDQLNTEFKRIGLKYDEGKKQWSLSGIPGRQIITIRPAQVWVNANQAVTVPANMVLGTEVTSRNGFTLFLDQNNKQFLVQTHLINYLP